MLLKLLFESWMPSGCRRDTPPREGAGKCISDMQSSPEKEREVHVEHTGQGEGSPLPALLGCTPTTVSIIFFDTPILTATAKPCMPKTAIADHTPQLTYALKT